MTVVTRIFLGVLAGWLGCSGLGILFYAGIIFLHEGAFDAISLFIFAWIILACAAMCVSGIVRLNKR